MQPDDVYRLTGVTDPRISPGGDTLAYVVWRADEAANAYPSSIWIHDAGGARRLTDGTRSDSQPRWSPDGRSIAFISTRGDEGAKAQLYVVSVDGGEPLCLTTMAEDVGDPDWSPDGSRIAFTSREPESAYDEDDERARAPRRFTRLRYRLDDVGWTQDRPQHVFTVAADGSEDPMAVTKGDSDDSGPRWSPDGSRIAFAGARHDNWDIDLVQDILVIDAVGGEATVLTATDGWCEAPAWSPDGSKIAYQYVPGRFDDPRHTQIAVIDVATGHREILTAGLDRNCGPYPSVREPIWVGDDLVFAVEDRGNTHVYRVSSSGGERPQPVLEGELNVTGYDARADRFVHTSTTPVTLSELWEGEARLTGVGDGFVAGVPPVAAERFDVVSPDDTHVDAWVMKPAGFDPSETYPVVLNIHGGPFTQYGNRFFDEFQVFARAGYVVLFSNPRGSSGYSEEAARAIRGPIADGPGWGTVDYEDLMAVVGTALERFDYCDPERLGVIGGSYGGFMTSWIISKTGRFKAACSERAVNNWHSMHGSSDLGWTFKGYFGAFAFEAGATQAYLDHSPITYVNEMETPLLILHSESDLRCPIEQAEQLFTALRLLERDVEFVRFPGEGHELTRSGSPRHRTQRFQIVLDFFDRKLKA